MAVVPLNAPKRWTRILDGKVHEIVGRQAYVEEKSGWRLIVLMPAASYWIRGRMVAKFDNTQITIFEDKWEEVCDDGKS